MIERSVDEGDACRLLDAISPTASERPAVARILIVDDEETDRSLIHAVLTRAGHETVVAAGGEEALRFFLETGVDVVVTDLEMPDVHGFELITILREFERPPAVIALSGIGPFQLHMAEALGAGWTLQKPVDPALLLDAVRRAIDSAKGSSSPSEDTLMSG
jgi:CheY-like chemotaxis protein